MTRRVGKEAGDAGVRGACGGVETSTAAPCSSGGSRGLLHQALHSGGLCAGAREVLARLSKRGKFQYQMSLREVDRRANCRLDLFVSLFCLFVGIKPEKLYSASCVGREVHPLGVITHEQRHKPRAYQRQRHKPRTCQSMVNTLQVDGLARITGLSGSYSTTHPQPPNGIPPCLAGRIGFGRGEG